MPRPSKIERILNRFANACAADRAYGNHVSSVGRHLGEAIEKENRIETKRKKAE